MTLPTIWIMRTATDWYPVEATPNCKPEEHGKLNPHVVKIEDTLGRVLWQRETVQ